MPQDWRKSAAGLLALVITAIAGGVGLGIVIDDDHAPDGGHHRTVTVKLGKPAGAPGPAGDTVATVKVPAAAVDQAKASDVGDHEGLKTEQPVGAARDDLEAAQDQQDRLASNDALPIVTPLAAPSQRGCTTRLVQNYSSRRGVRPRLLVVHYTVSPNRPGWDDVWSVVALFDRPAFQASATYVIDAEGHCAYIVRESDKSWTQAAANPVSISVELINSGREPTLAGTAGLKRIGQVFADAGKRWAIPLQAGAVNGCVVTRPGIIDHKALGACGGGHVDVSPYTVGPVIAAARAAAGASSTSTGAKVPASVRAWCARSRSSDTKANAERLRLVARRGWECKGATPIRHQVTATDRTTCQRLQAWRRAGRPAAELARNVRRRRALDARGVYCPTSGPPRVKRS